MDDKVLLDGFIYKKKYESFDSGILMFIDDIKKHNDELVELKRNGYELDFRCSVVSESGQIGWTVPQVVLSYLLELGAELSFSVFSYGLVEND